METFKIEVNRFVSTARLSQHSRFLWIAQESFALFEIACARIDELEKQLGFDLPQSEEEALFRSMRSREIGLDAAHERRTRCAVSSIVFCSIYLEGFIYDYAVVVLGNRFVRKGLDKLDLVSKWRIYPRLVCGKSLPEDSASIQRLQKLVRERNRLVHPKSMEWPGNESVIDMLKNGPIHEADHVRNALACATELPKALSELDPEHPFIRSTTTTMKSDSAFAATPLALGSLNRA